MKGLDQRSLPIAQILRRPFGQRGGSCWVADAQELCWASDLPGCDRSNLVVYEDNVALGPPHAAHTVVDQVGRGAYSHWGSNIFFSSSDNSDPNSNGREYKALLAVPPRWMPMYSQGCHVYCRRLSVFDEFLKIDIELFAEDDSIVDCDLVTARAASRVRRVLPRRAELLWFLFGKHSRSTFGRRTLRLLEKLRLPHGDVLLQLLESRSGHFLRMVLSLRLGTSSDIYGRPSELARDTWELVEASQIQVRLKSGRLVEFALSKLAESHWSYHDEAFAHLAELMRERESGTFLEIGGRGAESALVRQRVANNWRYLALDIKPGDNVDVVGDVHTMSSQLGKAAVDVVYSVSVFEHLYMPWRAVLEIGAVLKVGGLCYIHTPYFWPVHEIPWDFFRCQQVRLVCALQYSHRVRDLEDRRPRAVETGRAGGESTCGGGKLRSWASGNGRPGKEGCRFQAALGRVQPGDDRRDVPRLA